MGRFGRFGGWLGGVSLLALFAGCERGSASVCAGSADAGTGKRALAPPGEVLMAASAQAGMALSIDVTDGHLERLPLAGCVEENAGALSLSSADFPNAAFAPGASGTFAVGAQGWSGPVLVGDRTRPAAQVVNHDDFNGAVYTFAPDGSAVYVSGRGSLRRFPLPLAAAPADTGSTVLGAGDYSMGFFTNGWAVLLAHAYESGFSGFGLVDPSGVYTDLPPALTTDLSNGQEFFLLRYAVAGNDLLVPVAPTSTSVTADLMVTAVPLAGPPLRLASGIDDFTLLGSDRILYGLPMGSGVGHTDSVYEIPVAGGAPTHIVDGATFYQGSPDGRWILVSTAATTGYRDTPYEYDVAVLDAATDATVTTIAGPAADLRFGPGGNAVTWIDSIDPSAYNVGFGSVWATTLPTGMPQHIATDGQIVGWVGASRLLVRDTLARNFGSPYYQDWSGDLYTIDLATRARALLDHHVLAPILPADTIGKRWIYTTGTMTAPTGIWTIGLP